MTKTCYPENLAHHGAPNAAYPAFCNELSMLRDPIFDGPSISIYTIASV